MSKIIGPIDIDPKERAEDWLILRMYRASIDFMRTRNGNGKYNSALEKETRLYKDYLRNYVRMS